ncbi:glycerol-3-phosphate dehydrogenase/oxidase [Pedobacter sp. BS3]|uniref:glycerol-3-phosphate dehydrogenase/oxidase n=1 Tax=Pedobacter sp. BS3 TaxID=2567937 RepID=UPI0018D92310|nr:glycerol-3-phosphate dehydrogenase/oxidase [Pedobacter sp. BS3]
MQFRRDTLLQKISDAGGPWDILIVGGGATGLGAAVDAASRGYKTLLLEQLDFAKGTSSRSTKLVHGGVRYLAQGDIGLVREALYERGLLLKNAPHLAHDESFVIPNYEWWGGPFYTIGLTIYDLLAGRLSLGRSKLISKKETLRRIPGIKSKGLYNGVVYHDGQFDDSRLAVNLAQTCVEQGGVLLNYFRVNGLIKENGKIKGVTATDQETNKEYRIAAKVVVNATGVFVDDLLAMDAPEHKPMVRPSQGVHIVLDRSFMPGEDALMIPKTEDGRVLFAVPWHDKLVVGTTDTPLNEHSIEPVALEEEIEFIIRTASKYLERQPQRKDVLSVFAGLRPLAAPSGDSTKTKEISRSHKLIVSASGLLTMTGGKWTTYRKMSEDIVDKAIEIGGLKPVACATRNLRIHGYQEIADQSNPFFFYGSDQEALLKLIDENKEWAQKINPKAPYICAQVIWAVRNEMARTVEDFLARRIRALFLDARVAIDMAPRVAELMAAELGKDDSWQKAEVERFTKLANGYLLSPYYPQVSDPVYAEAKNNHD